MIKDIAKLIKNGQYDEAIHKINSDNLDVNQKIPASKKYDNLLALAFSNYFIFNKDPKVLIALIERGADFYVNVNEQPLLLNMTKYNMHEVINSIIKHGLDLDKFKEKTQIDLKDYIKSFNNKASYLIKEKFADSNEQYVTFGDALKNKDIEYIVANKEKITENEKKLLAQHALINFRKMELSLEGTKKLLDAVFTDDFNINYTFTNKAKNGEYYNNTLVSLFYKNKFSNKKNLTPEKSELMVYLINKGISPFFEEDSFPLYLDVIAKDDNMVFNELLLKGLLEKSVNMRIIIGILNGNSAIIESALLFETKNNDKKDIVLQNKKLILEGCIERKKKKIIDNYFNNYNNIEINKLIDIDKVLSDVLYNEDLSTLKLLSQNFDLIFDKDISGNLSKMKKIVPTYISPMIFSLLSPSEEENKGNKKSFKKRKDIYDFIESNYSINWNRLDSNGQTFLFRVVEGNNKEDIEYISQRTDMTIIDKANLNVFDRVLVYANQTQNLIDNANILFDLGARPVIEVKDFLDNKIRRERNDTLREKLNDFTGTLVSKIEKENLNKIFITNDSITSLKNKQTRL